MKYVVIEVTGKGFVSEIPVIFPNSISHASMARALLTAVDLRGDDRKVVAAGKIESGSLLVPTKIHNFSVCRHCTEEESSADPVAKFKSRYMTDDELIKNNDKNHGIKLFTVTGD